MVTNYFLQFSGNQLVLRVKSGEDITDIDAVEAGKAITAGEYSVSFNAKGKPVLAQAGEGIAVGRVLDNGSIHFATETAKERMNALMARMRKAA